VGVSFRWGVAGPGGIASRFADAMTLVDDGDIVAVASRSAERADAYADRFGIARRYGDYGGLAEDRDVDIVYVATPQSRHVADALLYVEAGKHVLCEKPFALNARQAQRMVDAARAAGVFLMEAMWSRFLPSYIALGDVLANGRIGEPLFVEADFGFRAAVDPAERHFDLDLGGGGLLDLGIYPVQLSTLVLGLPDRIVADGVLGATGVDEQVAAVLHHPGDRMSVVKAALRVPMACTARIAGTDGWIGLPAFMHCPYWLDVGALGTVERIDAPYDGDGLRFEVFEVHRCINEGLTESPVMSLDETVAIAGILDTIRAQIGLVFPGE
jgi:predicted dehydrogenase